MSDVDVCSHGRPDHIELIQQLRSKLGLFAGAMPITPKEAFEQALAAIADINAMIRDLGACDPPLSRETSESIMDCALCAAIEPFREDDHDGACPWRRARQWVDIHPT